MKSFGLIGLVLRVRDEVIVEAGGDCAPPRVRVDTDGLYQIFAMYGRVVVGMLREKGKDTLVWPVDEFLFTGGSIKIDIHGGENFTLSKANLMVMRMGQTIPFECSDNFAKVAVLLDGEDKVTLV
ncbi:hypothetical protein S40293_01719 [Stachybotrys chartarum IBT 40293]|nr:hypothetical protein S40293_01719 [Stachybotrys chartarum IBT 40293]